MSKYREFTGVTNVVYSGEPQEDYHRLHLIEKIAADNLASKLNITNAAVMSLIETYEDFADRSVIEVFKALTDNNTKALEEYRGG